MHEYNRNLNKLCHKAHELYNVAENERREEIMRVMKGKKEKECMQ